MKQNQPVQNHLKVKLALMIALVIGAVIMGVFYMQPENVDSVTDKNVPTVAGKQQADLQADDSRGWMQSVTAEDLQETEIVNQNSFAGIKFPLVAAIPEKDLYLYGRGDQDTGVILKYGDQIEAFNWTYLTPRFVLPQMSLKDLDNDGHQELICVLYNGSGTGVSIEELHVLSQEKNGQWIDHALRGVTGQSYLKQVENQLSYDFDKQSGEIVLKLGSPQKEYRIKDHFFKGGSFSELGYGNIVHFAVDDEIQLQLDVGAIYENTAEPQYFGQITAAVIYDNGQLQLQDFSFETME